jgi:hypothetical protein
MFTDIMKEIIYKNALLKLELKDYRCFYSGVLLTVAHRWTRLSFANKVCIAKVVFFF